MTAEPTLALPTATPPASTLTTSTLPTGTLTFLFTDIEGSTQRWEHQREAMAAALVRHDALVREAIEQRGGHVFKTVGDAFYAAFADADAALAAALDAQRALAAEDWSAFGADFADLRVRMGLHTGKADARRNDYFGQPLNRTARLMAAGHGGQVLLSLATQQLVRDVLPDGVSLRDLGEHRLKDLRHSEHIYQLLAPDLPDIATPLVTADRVRPRDRILVDETGAERSLADTLSALLAAVRGDEGGVTLTLPQVRQIQGSRVKDLTEYRLGRIAEWSQPRYRLDGRFVDLTLLVDQGEEAAAGRWAAKQERYDDLGTLLAAVPDPAVVVLSPPGGGKSTLLRHLELDVAIANLRGEDDRDTVTFFIQLNQYKPAEPGHPLPSPERWLATRWAAARPDLRPLDDLLAEGRMILLLDALNEMPASSEREFRARVGLWKDWLVRLAKEQPGNRVVFSCRTLDYSTPLSTPALRVPQVQIEALADKQVAEFLRLYSPLRGEGIWAALAGTPQLEALRAPFFLALLVNQVEATGELASDRAGLFTGFVRQAMKREVERDNPLFAIEEVLAGRDLRRLAQWQWRDAYELPERGALVPKLAGLAYGMQESEADGESSQVRVAYDTALGLLDHPQDEAIVKAGLSISVLDEDPAADEVLYRHQLLQEYFAARVLARAPRPELVAAPWRSAEVLPGLREVLAALPPAETLPALPTTGWEETTVLAAAMTADAEGFVRGVMAANLALAGRCAAQPMVRERLSEVLLDELRWALVARSRDGAADLRARIAAGLALGNLGDPRFERRIGPYGEFLLPPLVAIPAGAYPIGDDEPIDLEGRLESDHIPRHAVSLASFAIGQFAVTNAEYACFMGAGGYEDERWWDTPAARAWRSGEGTAEGDKRNNRWWRREFRARPARLAKFIDEGRMDEATAERWQAWIAMGEAAFELALAERWPGGRFTEPRWWNDAHYNNPAQPVVGICWYEARAYCAWLSAQTGVAVSLPTEVEREAAARGTVGRRYAYGEDFDPLGGNTFETHLKQPSPVGVFLDGDTPEGISDLAGSTADWTNSLFGRDDDKAEFTYPYDPTDGREDSSAGADVLRVLRGGSWDYFVDSARAAFRYYDCPGVRSHRYGLRLRRVVPIP